MLSTDNAPTILVLGGARSGKSTYAERLFHSHPGVTYIATAQAWDDEMAARIAAHQARRSAEWVTVNAPIALPDALSQQTGVVLVDCLTLWLSNVMLAERDVAADVEALLKALASRTAATVLVSNEVGEGIVPTTKLGRDFRDRQGTLNQQVASVATGVVKLVAGCPLVVKPNLQPELSI